MTHSVGVAEGESTTRRAASPALLAVDGVTLRFGGRRDVDISQAVRKAAKVTVGLEQLAADAAPHFVHRVAENEAAIENRDLRVLEREILAVQVDDQLSRGGC